MSQLIKIETTSNPNALSQIEHVGLAANNYVSQFVFTDYRDRAAKNTLIRQDNDLRLFADFLVTVGATDTPLDFTQAGSWRGVTHGLVKLFVQAQLNASYAVSTVNIRLATIKAYASLAFQAHTLSEIEHAQIKVIKSYNRAAIDNINQKRASVGLAVRCGKTGKKAQSTHITPKQADILKNNPPTPQGLRDNLLMCLLLEHGLRCGEVALLKTSAINLDESTITFYRPKVKLNPDKAHPTHILTQDALLAAKKYFNAVNPDSYGPLLLASRKSGQLIRGQGMSDRAITGRVESLGKALGIAHLSAHDCRHYAATTYAKQGRQVNELMDIFGWTSPAMAVGYIDSVKVVKV